MSHINQEMMPESADAKNFSRVLKPPGGGSSSTDSVFSDGSSMVSSMASSPNESRASSTSPKTPAKKYHMKFDGLLPKVKGGYKLIFPTEIDGKTVAQTIRDFECTEF